MLDVLLDEYCPNLLKSLLIAVGLPFCIEGAPAFADTDEDRAIANKTSQKVESDEQASMTLASLADIPMGVSLVTVAQNLQGDGSVNEKTELNYRLDVELTLPAGEFHQAKGSLFAHVRMGQGTGVSHEADTFTGGFNSTVFQGDEDDEIIQLSQLLYQLDIPLSATEDRQRHMTIFVGKMDPFGFFDQNAIADDESSQFLNSIFVHNPLLDASGDIGVDDYGSTYGLVVAYQQAASSTFDWQFSLGVFGDGVETSLAKLFRKPLVLAQLEFSHETTSQLSGNYRFYAWTTGHAVSAFDETTDRHSGFGISLDQQLSEFLTMYARYGHAITDEVLFDQAITIGLELTGQHWGRSQDRFGLSFGWIDASHQSDAVLCDENYRCSNSAEYQVEMYYAFEITPNVAISPDIQWLKHPSGQHAGDDLLVYGLRVAANF